MESKEALDWLNAIINKPETIGGNPSDNNEALSAISSDLQILSILKKHPEYLEIVRRFELTSVCDSELQAIVRWWNHGND